MSAARVRVDLFGADGRLVRALANGVTVSGAARLAWDGRDRAGSVVPEGVYFLRAASVAPARAISTAKIIKLR